MENMTNMENKISMDSIMDASLGEVSNDLTVTFKKTILIRPYETEVLEATNTVKFDHPLIGIERMFVTAILEIQMEYTAYINLTTKGLITNTQFQQRKEELEQNLYNIKVKADQILGAGVIDKYLEFKNLEKWGHQDV